MWAVIFVFIPFCVSGLSTSWYSSFYWVIKIVIQQNYLYPASLGNWGREFHKWIFYKSLPFVSKMLFYCRNFLKSYHRLYWFLNYSTPNMLSLLTWFKTDDKYNGFLFLLQVFCLSTPSHLGSSPRLTFFTKLFRWSFW